MSHVMKTQSDIPNGSVDICLTAIKDLKDVMHPNFDKTPLPFELAFTAKLEDGSKVVIKEETTGVMRANNWAKRFYRSEDKKGNDVTRFSRYYTLNALLEIFRAKKDKQVLAGDESGELDIDVLLKKPFKAAVIMPKEGAEYDPFINWIDTFEQNGVPVWDAVNSRWLGSVPAGESIEAVQTKALDIKPEEVELDPEELPF